MWGNWSFLQPSLWGAISLVFLITSMAIAIIIIFEKRSPYITAAWILALVLLPGIGLVFYLIFGQEYRKNKMFSRRGLKNLGRFRTLASRQLARLQKNELKLPFAAMEKEKVVKLLMNNSHSLLTTGNRLKILNNAEKTFKAIFAELEKARHHIHLEYYIIEDDEIGNRLKEILIRKSLQGVEVRVIVDDVGSWGLGKKFMKELRNAGVDIQPFMEVRFPRLTSRVNYRNHRKIAIIDGTVGFTGGINFADRYLKGLKKIGPWRDTHLQIEGDAVACLQIIFAADWYFIKHENLKGPGYYKTLSDGEGTAVQISACGPDSNWDSIEQAFFCAISGARKEVIIVTPYLMPPPSILTALKTSALSGVNVQILMPEFSDAVIPKWCSFSFVEELLEAGVHIFFYQKGFIHSKLIIVDRIFSSIGTTNFDFRSLEINFEVNAFVYDANFTRQLLSYYKIDQLNSREILFREWKNRSWFSRLRESLAHMVSPMY
jgi:cardiolipin synthase A/B